MTAHLEARYHDLLHAIRLTRRRWRTKTLLRGLAISLAAGFAAFLLSVWGLNYFHYSDVAINVFRALTWVALVGIVLRFLVLPLSRRVDDQQVALYIEENEPALQEELLSAIEFGQRGVHVEDEPFAGTSPRLVERLLESALLNCQQIDYGASIERSGLRRFSAMVAGGALAGMAAILISPAFLQYGALVLFLPWKGAAAANPYWIDVSPGSVTVARGADQEVEARLIGFSADRVELALRRGSDGDWERWPMHSYDDPNERLFMLLDLEEESEYFVEAQGVRSPLYRIGVADLPYAERLDLEYHFPAYTGLSVQYVEDGGDIAALRGTEVLVKVVPTVKVDTGNLRVEGEEGDEVVALEVNEEGHLVARLIIERDTFYQVELLGPLGDLIPASPEYVIEVLEDQPPVISFDEPGRDVRASRIEEVFTELRVEDDYGVRNVDLFYSVNGGEEQRRRLVSAGQSTRKHVQVGHTFFLEDEDLVDGDFIAYFARATDSTNAASSGTTTDIYFIEVAPFSKNYSQGQQGGGRGGGQGGAANAMSQRQRLIISATFKLNRDRDDYARREYEENLTTVGLMQGRLKAQVQSLVTRMGNRLRGEDEFQGVIENLQNAVEQMKPAEEKLAAFQPKAALSPEQQALKFLQRAEATFRDVQISRQSGGGGGGGQRMAEDLAALFELELDKLHNQYETVQRGERQKMQTQIDEALQRLKELARRQQQENERARQLASQMGSSSAGGARQRRIIEETEELARRLERLARDRSRPDLRETAQRLRQAADAMKKAMASRSAGEPGGGGEAIEQMRQARRLLEKNREFQLQESMEDLQERAGRVQRMQERIQGGVRGLDPEGDRKLFGQATAELLERKDELGREIRELEDQIDAVAREARSGEQRAARALGEASQSIRRNQLKEKIRYSKGVIRGRSTEYAERFEEEIRSDIEEMRESLQKAQAAMGRTSEDRVAQTLEGTRDLVRSLESMQQRIEDQARQSGSMSQPGSEQGQTQGSEPGREDGRGSPNGGERRASGGASRIGTGSYDAYEPGIFTPEDLRQLAGEYSRQLRAAEELRKNLRELGVDAKDFDRILDRMRKFQIRGINQDLLALEELRDEIVEGLKQFEYRLWREMEGGDDDKLYLAGSDEIPPGYRELVEEYFTSLAEGE